MANKLAGEVSPYLLQHKDNPVDWYPWGQEALARARAEGKPILLSIGYAACHWCHVMERESFEDPETAALMNEGFVCVKVDREERPDLDAVYMDAVTALSGHGGWPMTVFLTPDGAPFWGGTYFPPTDRGGMPSFRKVLAAISEAWTDKRADVEAQGRALIDHIGFGARLRPGDDVAAGATIETALSSLQRSHDRVWGGFGGAPKFPQPMVVDFLLQVAAGGSDAAADMATRTLDAMAAGGMFDQLGGGFARYSVDRQWIVPHFEKMLYDNAQLLRTYARSWAATGSSRHREVAEMTAGWMLAEMVDPGGGLWSSLDADSEGHEGKFYVWSLDEVVAVCGDDAEAAIARFGFSPDGNFEGANIPVHTGAEADPGAVERARAALLARRSERVRPATDTKVLASWNGLAVAALAEAGALAGEPEWIAAARRAMEFVLGTMRIDGRLHRAYRRSDDGSDVVRQPAFCEDYALVLSGCLALYQATFEARWLAEARWAADEAIRLFHDPDTGGFFTTGSDGETLVVRSKDVVDNAFPSANSVMALELQRLALVVGDYGYEDVALEPIRLVGDTPGRSPEGFGYLLQAVHFHASEPPEIVIVGDPAGADTAALLDAVKSAGVPDKVVVVASEDDSEQRDLVPLLEGRTMLDGRATAYVCRRGACDLPVDTPQGVLDRLARRSG